MLRKRRLMPKNLQIFLLKKRYGDLDQIDWQSIVDGGLTFPENVCSIEQYYMDEINRAQYESGYKTESEKQAQAEWSQELRALKAWHIEQEDDAEIHSVEVEIVPHKVRVRGKEYTYGRIQSCCNAKLIGLRAKVTVTYTRP